MASNVRYFWVRLEQHDRVHNCLFPNGCVRTLLLGVLLRWAVSKVGKLLEFSVVAVVVYLRCGCVSESRTLDAEQLQLVASTDGGSTTGVFAGRGWKGRRLGSWFRSVAAGAG